MTSPTDKGTYLELHTLKNTAEVGTHITWHLPPRMRLGNAIIVCDRPEDMVAAFAKRWKKIVRVVERERASTLRPEIREQTARLLKLLRNTRFTARVPAASIGPMVWLASANSLTRIPQNCATIYIAVPVSEERLADWIGQTNEHAAVITYRIEDSSTQ